jgi:hypothetical protein
MAANLMKMSWLLIEFLDTVGDSVILFWMFNVYSILSNISKHLGIGTLFLINRPIVYMYL